MDIGSELSIPDSASCIPSLDLSTAAALLGIRSDTLRQQALAGKLRTERVGRKHFTAPAWLAEYRANHFMQQGRPTELTLRDRYIHRFKALQTWDKSRKPDVVTRLAIEAGVYAVLRHPMAEPDELKVILKKHRVTILHRESAEARERAVESILDQVFADASIRDQQYQAHKADSRDHKSPLGAQWQTEFWARLRVDDTVTSENIGAVARIDLEVATALGKQLLAEDPGLTLLDCRARLMQAMLEGSENLPSSSLACQQAIEATVDKVIRQLAQDRKQQTRPQADESS